MGPALHIASDSEFVTASIIPTSLLAKLMPGVLLLVAFIPVHIRLWENFPVWYHLTFLLSLVPLTYFGATMTRAGWRIVRYPRPGEAI
jgi:hypothetical protein